MRTKQEVINSYLGVESSDDVQAKEIDTNMASKLVEDVMNLWGEEVLSAITLEIGSVLRKSEPGWELQTADHEMLTVVNNVRREMYPLPTWSKKQ